MDNIQTKANISKEPLDKKVAISISREQLKALYNDFLVNYPLENALLIDNTKLNLIIYEFLDEEEIEPLEVIKPIL